MTSRRTLSIGRLSWWAAVGTGIRQSPGTPWARFTILYLRVGTERAEDAKVRSTLRMTPDGKPPWRFPVQSQIRVRPAFFSSLRILAIHAATSLAGAPLAGGGSFEGIRM